jgi:thioredoxin 1
MPSDNFESTYLAVEPTREEVNSLSGIVAIEFGAPWCPICQGAQEIIGSVIRSRSDVRHLKVEDGSGKPLGRSFRIKLWPTLVVLKDGQEISRVVRPTEVADIQQALSAT